MEVPVRNRVWEDYSIPFELGVLVEALRGPSVHFVMPCLDLLEVVVGDPRIDLGGRTTLDHASDAY